MQYICLIYENEELMAKRNEQEMVEFMGAYGSYTNEVKESGMFVSGDALQATNTATSVRVRNGKMTTTDGPFAETKEQLGGYYLLECKNIEEAIESASKIPSAKSGTIEIRPVMLYNEQ